MWKKFNFFAAELLQSADPGSPLYAIQSLDISCVTSGRDNLVFGDSEGGITICNQEFSLKRFLAHDFGVSFAYQYISSNMLLTIGDGTDVRSKVDMDLSRNVATRFRSNLNSNETYKWMLEDLQIKPTMSEYVSMKNATLKLWLLDKSDENGFPLCIRSFKLFEKIDEEIITSLTVNEDNQMIIVGCLTGHIYLIQGDLMRIKKLNISLLPNHFSSPITSISVYIDSPSVNLFAASSQQIGCYSIPRESKKNIGYETLEEGAGCDMHCGCVNRKGIFIAARDDGLFYYSPTSRSTSYLLPGHKSYVYSYHESVVVCRTTDGVTTLSVYNMENSCEEYSMQVIRNGNTEEISHIFVEWGLLFFMTTAHVVYLIREKDAQSKLDILYERKLYPMALTLGEEWGMRDKDLSAIYQMYGDWLFSQNDFDGAINAYIKTIGFTDASNIIRHFLDASHIHRLMRYLEELHRRSMANRDHTTLLMNCYTKLRDMVKLKAFVLESSLGESYDVTAAIDALVAEGYNREALHLAARHHMHARYLLIQIDRSAAYGDAVDYLHTLTLADASAQLVIYGKRLLDAVPDAATALLIDVCTAYRSTSTPTAQPAAAAPETFIHCFVDDSARLKCFLTAVVSQRPASDPLVWNTLLELTLRRDLEETGVTDEEHTRRVLDLLQNDAAKYEVDEALVLLQRYDCVDGLVFLYDRLHMYSVLLQQDMESGRCDDALQLCLLHGPADPSLWEHLLQAYAVMDDINTENLQTMLNAVVRSGAIPLLRILQSLSENPHIPREPLQELVVAQLTLEKSVLSTDEVKRTQLEAHAASVQTEIDTMTAATYCFRQTKCVGCGLPLELPVIHFLCGHSYHKTCVDNQDGGCPRCSVTVNVNKREEEIITVMEGMKKSIDGFAYVADYFGKRPFAEEEKKTIVEKETDVDDIPIQTLEL